MQTTLIQPYLFFGGRCQEAIAFYKSAIGAEIDHLSLYKDSPQPHPPGSLPPGFENKVMHASIRIGGSTIMASDGCGGTSSFNGFSLSLQVPGMKEAEAAFAALSEGGTVTLPLQKTFWSPGFGMLTDRFGLGWMINVAA